MHFESGFYDYDEFDDDTGMEWDDDSESDEAELMVCPSCGAKVYEDAPQCPVCGDYVTADTSAWSDRPWWWIVLGLVGIAAVVFALV